MNPDRNASCLVIELPSHAPYMEPAHSSFSLRFSLAAHGIPYPFQTGKKVESRLSLLPTPPPLSFRLALSWWHSKERFHRAPRSLLSERSQSSSCPQAWEFYILSLSHFYLQTTQVKLLAAWSTSLLDEISLEPVAWSRVGRDMFELKLDVSHSFWS